MKYHQLLNNIVDKNKNGIYSKEDAISKISEIENLFIEESEPDGDLTYAISLALDEIYNI